MSKINAILILGAWTAILPFLGFPYFVKNILFSLTGIAVICLACFLRKEFRKQTPKQKASVESFSENGNFMEREPLNSESVSN